jgi:alkanesulfonate monooxygenase SsuD/methylene tetrahydromethanopterin reductase-like flavin-dependent oxidoreductase (luciferase family)
LIGGNGPLRTLPLVAQYATEWNSLFIPPAKFASLSKRLDEMIAANGRDPAAVRRSMMTGLRYGRTQAELEANLPANRTVAELQALGMVVGTGQQVVDQLGQLAEAGVQRIMLQWLDLDDLDGLESLAQTVL